jgi:AraC family transcriptional regulator, dual regulator of chb operon
MKLHYSLFTKTITHNYASIINDPKQLSLEHSHDYFELVIVNKGNALHKVNGSIQPITRGTATFIRPTDTHYYSQLSKDFEIINILISQQSVTNLFNFLGASFEPERFFKPKLPPYENLSQNDLQTIVLQLEHLILAAHTLHSRSEAIYRATLVNVIHFCFPIVPEDLKIDMPSWFRRLCLEMMKYSNFTEGLPALRRLASKGSEHVARMFKKYLGKSPTEFVNQIRLEYAAHRIISTDHKIIDICGDSGFENLSHFYHQFVRQYGLPPKQFRKAAKGTDFLSVHKLLPVLESGLPKGIPLKNFIEGIE